MKRKYHFRAKVSYDNGNPVLNVKSVKNPQPIEFMGLKIPLVVNNSQRYREWVDTEYFLDFENSLDERNVPFGSAYHSKANQRNILSFVEKEVDLHISELLKGNLGLLKSEKFIRFWADNGFDLCRTTCNSRYGAPKIARKVVKSENNKVPPD